MENPHPVNYILDEKSVLRKFLEETLYSIGIPPMLRGYQYIIEAEMMIIEDSNRIFLLINEVYPNVAFQCYTTASRVERAIRHAIEISWSRNDENSLKKQYSNDLCTPTNKQFFEFLLNHMIEATQNNAAQADVHPNRDVPQI